MPPTSAAEKNRPLAVPARDAPMPGSSTSVRISTVVSPDRTMPCMISPSVSHGPATNCRNTLESSAATLRASRIRKRRSGVASLGISSEPTTPMTVGIAAQ